MTTTISHRRRLTFVALCTVGLFAPSLPAQTLPAPTEPPEITLKNVRWQPLPSGVRMAFVDHDQRAWFSCAASLERYGKTRPPAIEVVQQEIADAFKSKTPVLRYSWPVLFAADKSIWFSTMDRQWLLGYDGKTFVTREAHTPADKNGGFVGTCPNHLVGRETVPNLELAAAKIFVENEGISVYSAGEWKFHSFMERVGESFYGQKLVVAEPGGKAALIILANPARIFRYADGRLTALTLPRQYKTDTFTGAALAANGKLYLNAQQSGLAAVTVTSTEIEAPGLDPGRKPVLTLGGVDINTCIVTGVQSDSAGTLYVNAVNLPPTLDKSRRGGFVIARDGKERFVPGLMGQTHIGLFSDKNKTGWAKGGEGGRAAVRIDLSAPAPTLEFLPMSFYTMVHAVAADGTAYLSTYDPYAHAAAARGPWAMQLMAYKPSAPDDRHVVAPIEFELPNPDGCLTAAADGTIYATFADKGVCTFDGKTWKPLEDAPTLAMLTPAYDGSILARSRDGFSLIKNGKKISGKDLRTLIAENREAFAAAFYGAFPDNTWPGQSNIAIAADRNKNIWLLENGRFAVFADSWTDIPWQAAGQNPMRLFILGDGKTAVMTEYAGMISGPGKSKAFFATMKDGKPVLDPAPFPQWALHRDAAGKDWYLQEDPGPAGADGQPTRIINFKTYAPGGPQEKYTLPGAHVLFDAGGIQWVATRNDFALDEGLEYWKEGKKLGYIAIPGSWMISTTFSDGPGSLWVWSSQGLHHIVADNPANPTKFTLKSTRYVETARGGTMHFSIGQTMRVSKKGYLLCSSGDTSEDRLRTIGKIIPLDEEP